MIPSEVGSLLLFVVVPGLLSLVLTALLIHLAPRLHLVDQPSARKVHTRPVPRGGGLAIYLAFLTAVLVLPDVPRADLVLVVGLGGGIALLGLLDDLYSLSWQIRLAVQFLAAGVAVWVWPDAPHFLIRLVAVIWIVGLTNAMNMLDNMDMLSAGTAWIVCLLAALAQVVRLGQVDPVAMAPYLILLGALSGFLWFNRSPARIFMGDVGSTFLGFFLAVRSLQGGWIDVGAPLTWGVPFCFLAVPLYDMTTVVFLRLRQGRSPFHPDKQHLSHRLVRLGMTNPTAVRTIHLMALASGPGGLLLYRADTLGGFIISTQLLLWWLVVARIEYVPLWQAGSACPEPGNPEQSAS